MVEPNILGVLPIKPFTPTPFALVNFRFPKTLQKLLKMRDCTLKLRKKPRTNLFPSIFFFCSNFFVFYFLSFSMLWLSILLRQIKFGKITEKLMKVAKKE